MNIWYNYTPGGLKSEVKILDGVGATVHNTTYDYYRNASLQSINYDGDKVAGYSYDTVDLLSQIDFFSGGTATGAYDVYSYASNDPRNLLKTITMHYKNAAGQPAQSVINYTDANGDPAVDKAGNLLSMTDLAGHWTYTYDHGGRISSIEPPNPVPEQGLGGTYGYNWLGQLTNPPAEPNHLQYNQAGLPSLWSGMYSYTYKANGMPDQVMSPTGSTPIAAVSYDDAGFPSSFTAEGKTTAYHWDADGTYTGHLQTAGGTEDQSILTDPTTGAVLIDNTSGSTLSYACDPWGGTVASEPTDNQSALGQDNQLDTPQSFDQFPWHHECGAGSSGQLTYYHSDAAGRFQMSTASDGRMASTYAYAPNGKVVSTSDPQGARVAGLNRGPSAGQPSRTGFGFWGDLWDKTLGVIGGSPGDLFDQAHAGFRRIEESPSRYVDNSITMQPGTVTWQTWNHSADDWLDDPDICAAACRLGAGGREVKSVNDRWINDGTWMAAGMALGGVTEIAQQGAVEGGELELETHHIVERRNWKRLWTAVEDPRNKVDIEKWFHKEISRFYSSRNTELAGKDYSTVRQWMDTMDYRQQYYWGKKIMSHIRYGTPLR